MYLTRLCVCVGGSGHARLGVLERERCLVYIKFKIRWNECKSERKNRNKKRNIHHLRIRKYIWESVCAYKNNASLRL